MIRPALATASIAALTLIAGLAAAQTKPTQAPTWTEPAQTAPSTATSEEMLRARGEAYSRAPDSEQDPSELATTRALNAKVAASLEAADVLDAESTAAFEAANESYRIEAAAAETARMNYEADLRAADAARAQYDSDYAAWQERVRACEAGVSRACAAPAPQY